MVTFNAFHLGLSAGVTGIIKHVIHMVLMFFMDARAEGANLGDLVSHLLSAETLKMLILCGIDGFILGYLFAVVYNYLAKRS